MTKLSCFAFEGVCVAMRVTVALASFHLSPLGNHGYLFRTLCSRRLSGTDQHLALDTHLFCVLQDMVCSCDALECYWLVHRLPGPV